MKRRTITSEFWSRGSGKRLRGDALGQTIAHYLCNGCMSDWTGVYHVTLGTICDETGHDRADVVAALERVAAAGFGYYDTDAELAWVPNLAERELGGPLKAGDRRRKAIEKHLAALPEHAFVAAFRRRYLDAPSSTVDPRGDAPSYAPSDGALGTSLLPLDGSGSGSGIGNGGGSGSWVAGRNDDPHVEPAVDPTPPDWTRVLVAFDDAWESAHGNRLGLHGGSDNPRRAEQALAWARTAKPPDPWEAIRASVERFAREADERVRHPFAVWASTPGRWYGRGPMNGDERKQHEADLRRRIREMRQRADDARRRADPSTPEGVAAQAEADRCEASWRELCREAKGNEEERPGPARVVDIREALMSQAGRA